MKQKRPEWTDYFMKIAEDVSARATCLRRRYGAVVVDVNNKIVSTGYCGAPTGKPNCIDINKCKRQELNAPRGERYELCESVHAEMNALIQGDASRMIGSTIYIYGVDADTGDRCNGAPCDICERMVRNAGISRVVYYNADGALIMRPSL